MLRYSISCVAQWRRACLLPRFFGERPASPERVDLGSVHRASQPIALAFVAASRAEPFELTCGFDALGGHPHAKTAAERQNSPHNGGRAAVNLQALHEA